MLQVLPVSFDKDVNVTGSTHDLGLVVVPQSWSRGQRSFLFQQRLFALRPFSLADMFALLCSRSETSVPSRWPLR